ncbi:MAG TPA: RecX family transcriptional regulator, partial [Candidatus Saccharimonadales bacterium]|nr:RecX family transcriptional regulator [Candidatus Saccharimonadales bacterium]
MPTITAIKQQVKRAGRYSVYVDGKFAFGLSESGLLESRLASGQEIDAEQLKKLKKDAGLDKAYGNALRYVVMRPRSEWELHDYFRRKGIDEDAAAQIVDRLRSLDLLNDATFARAWVSNRRLLKTMSKRKLILELKQKHVSEDIIREVLEEDTTDEKDAIKKLIEKKHNHYPDKQKLLQYLARQGFNYDDIKQAM